MRHSKRILGIGLSIVVAVACRAAYAQTGNQAADLAKCVMEKTSPQELNACFEALRVAYFQDNRYADFVELLSSLKTKNKNLGPFTDYYTALARYRQLKYLEEIQGWDDYFANGNTYRDELTASAQSALAQTTPADSVHVASLLVLWKFHKDQQDAFVDEAYAKLADAAVTYAKAPQDTGLVKRIAQDLAAYGERAKSKEIYKLYVDRIITSATSDAELAQAADGFFNEGNLDLASSIYDQYIARLEAAQGTDKSSMTAALVDIAKKFSFKDNASCDPAYAEKLLKKLEAIAGAEIFNEELIYLRGYNLEKIKEYKEAYDVYNDLVSRFPASSHADEATFKMGVMQAYAFRNIARAQEHFQKGAQKETASGQVIASLYQLGLLAQWQADSVKAKEYYGKLIERAAGNYPQIQNCAEARIAEIDGQKEIEYNLKVFLDASLKAEYPGFNPSKADVNVSQAAAKRGETVTVTATAYAGESGCMHVSLYYLWSGDMGGSGIATDQAEFTATYTNPGTNVVNLVVMSPNGILDRTFIFIDIS
jgi:TolA-binding protein